MNGDPEMDPVLAALLLGELESGKIGFDDPRVVGALKGQPGLRGQWEVMLALGSELSAEGVAMRDAVAAGAARPSEEATLEGFRSVTRASKAGSGMGPVPGATNDRHGRLSTESRRPSKTWVPMLLAAGAVAAGVVFFLRGRMHDPVVPGPASYLGQEDGLFVLVPAPAFGTARWQRAGGAAFHLQVRRATGGTPEDTLLVDERQLNVTSWTIDPKRLSTEVNELQWTLTLLDAGATPAGRSVWLQRRD